MPDGIYNNESIDPTEGADDNIFAYTVGAMRAIPQDKNWLALKALLPATVVGAGAGAGAGAGLSAGLSAGLGAGLSAGVGVIGMTLYQFAKGAWNDKPAVKKLTNERYWLRDTEKKEIPITDYHHGYEEIDKHDTVVGFTIKGAEGKVFDYDIVANLLWGVRTASAGAFSFWYWLGKLGAEADDVLHQLSSKESGKDLAAIALGRQIYKQHGFNITPAILKQELLAHADELNVHDRADLITKEHRVKEGDTLLDIAQQNGVSVEQILAHNPRLRKNPADLRTGMVIDMPDPNREHIIAPKNQIGQQGPVGGLSNMVDKDYEVLGKFEDAKEKLVTDNVNPDSPTGTNFYIWKTVGDGKVRPLHKSYEGRIFHFAHPPVSGNPGDAAGCRCRALPYYPENALYR